MEKHNIIAKVTMVYTVILTSPVFDGVFMVFDSYGRNALGKRVG